MNVLTKLIIAALFLLLALVIIPPENIPYDLTPYRSNIGRYLNSTATYKAIVIGGTGAVGRELVRELLTSKHTSLVAVITRKKLSITHEKLKNIVLSNFDDLLNDNKQIFTERYDAAFSTIGTTRKIAGSDEAFIRVDLEYNIGFARHALRNYVRHFSLLTSIFANEDSWLFYPRIKGLVENAIQAFSFASISIFRPSLLITNREEERPFERLAQVILPRLCGFFRGPLAKYGPINATDVARAMRLEYEVRVFSNEGPIPEPKNRIYESDEIQQIADITTL